MNYENDLTGLANNRVLDYPFVRKWDAAETDIIDLPLTYNDQVYLRISETYLLKAEAQFKLGDAAQQRRPLILLEGEQMRVKLPPPILRWILYLMSVQGN